MVNRYYTDINAYDLLDPKHERILATRALLGDDAARDELITSNLRFVVSVAKQYVNQGIPLEDLISEGNLGLITAVEKYDPTKNYKFITYASYWIRQSIMKAIAEQNRTIRIPTNKVAQLSKVRQAEDQLEMQLERKPTLEEVQEHLGDDFDVASVVEYQDRPLGLNGSTNEEQDLIEMIPDPNSENPDESLRETMFNEELGEIMRDCTEREKDILYLYYGLGTGDKMTLEQIGYLHGICRERVRQIKAKTIDFIKSHPNLDTLKEFL